jgi:hypothetical protein
MPGASLDVLALADVDFHELVTECGSLEVAMAHGRSLELISYAADGSIHRLTADIGGWDRLPVASDGVIRDGAWGNVPSGETYIAPIEGSARGSVVINGSVPGLVMGPETEIVLNFDLGRLTHIEPAGCPAALWLDETQFGRARRVGDDNWANLAEIGVGCNRAVHHLTGNMLFDEKAAGTAHIALGSNMFMGGAIHASIHCDMVIRQPSLVVDSHIVVDRGRLQFRERDWYVHHDDVFLQDSPMRMAVQVARSGVQAGQANDGRLQRVLRPEPGRVSACSVGDAETARLAGRLYALIPDEGDWLVVERLAARAGLDLDLVRRLLHVMWRYDLVRVR